MTVKALFASLGSLIVLSALGGSVYLALGHATKEAATQSDAAIGRPISGAKLEQSKRDHEYLHTGIEPK